MNDIIHVRLELTPDLHKRLKHRAVDEGKTFAKLLRELLAAACPKDAAPADSTRSPSPG